MRILVFVAVLLTGVLVTLYIADRIHPAEESVLDRPPESELYSRRNDQLWDETYVRSVEIGREFWELIPEGDSAYSAEQAQEWARELVPLVEQASARSFVSFPTIELVGREKLAAVLTEELAVQLGNMIAAGEDVDTSRLAEQHAILLTPLVLGKYGIHDRVLYLVPKNLPPALELLGAEESLFNSIAKLIIAHELAHALQDQIVDLNVGISKIDSHQEMEAYIAAIEGHAVFVEDRVGEQLQLSEAARTMATMLSSGAIEFDDPAFEMINQVAVSPFEQAYIGGRDFMAYHAEQGGAERLWHILAHPPKSFSQIFAPHTYGSHIEKTVNLLPALRGLDRFFRRQHWPSYIIEVNESQLRRDYALLDTASRGEIMSRIRGAYAMRLADPSNAGFGSVTVFVLSDPTYATTMIRILEEAGSQNIRRMASGYVFGLANEVMDDLQGIQSDRARIHSYEFGPSGESLTQYQIVRVARGTILVEIIDVGAGLRQETFKELAERTFDQVNAVLESDG
jgi:hypothetical protein